MNHINNESQATGPMLFAILILGLILIVMMTRTSPGESYKRTSQTVMQISTRHIYL